MQRIYLRHLDLLIRSDNRSRLFLAYLKIRSTSKQRCGGFNLSQLIETLSVSDTSARKSLKRLINYGYVSEVKKGLYKVNSFKTLVGDNLHERIFKITEEQLFSYSWKNISHFRAMLVELRIQHNRNVRLKQRKGYTTVDRHGVVEKVKSQSNRGFDTLMSGQYVADMTDKSIRTIFSYRKKQSEVVYSKRQIIKIKDTSDYKEASKKYKGLGGKMFSFGNLLIYVPISSRIGRVKFNGY
jgi:Mn-dependent DtxR family transcriptional regulator